MRKYETLIMKLIAIVILPFSLYASAWSILHIIDTVQEPEDKWSKPYVTSYHRFSTVEKLDELGIPYESEVCGDIGDRIESIELDFKIKDRWD